MAPLPPPLPDPQPMIPHNSGDAIKTNRVSGMSIKRKPRTYLRYLRWAHINHDSLLESQTVPCWMPSLSSERSNSSGLPPIPSLGSPSTPFNEPLIGSRTLLKFIIFDSNSTSRASMLVSDVLKINNTKAIYAKWVLIRYMYPFP